MKIYAGYTDYIDLSKYTGKDAWIRCDGPRGPEYVRVLRKFTQWPSDERYTVNLLTPDRKNALNTTATHDLAMQYLTDRYTTELSEFRIHEPLEVLTTNQLYPDYNPDITKFDKYIGKGVWVLAEEYSGYQYFVLPIRREDNLLYSKIIAPEYLDGSWEVHQADFENWTDYVTSGEPSTTFIDGWHITQPIELLTTDEILAEYERHTVDDEDD